MSGAEVAAGGSNWGTSILRARSGLLDVVKSRRENGVKGRGTPEAVVKKQGAERPSRGGGETAKSSGKMGGSRLGGVTGDTRGSTCGKTERGFENHLLPGRAVLGGVYGGYLRPGGEMKWPGRRSRDDSQTIPSPLYPRKKGKKIRLRQDLAWIKVTRLQIVGRLCLRWVRREGAVLSTEGTPSSPTRGRVPGSAPWTATQLLPGLFSSHSFSVL